MFLEESSSMELFSNIILIIITYPMKKVILCTILIIVISYSFTSCRDTKKSESIENAVENAADATEGALEQTGKAIDEAAEKTKEAAEATQEAVEKTIKN